MNTNQETNDLQEITDFYAKYFDGKDEYAFIEGDISRPYPNDFRIRRWQALKTYSAITGLTEYESRYYVENCHCCGETFYNKFLGNMYCSPECSIAIEEDGYRCYFNHIDKTHTGCLVCQRANTTDVVKKNVIAPIVEQVNKFYNLSNYDTEYTYYGVSTYLTAESDAFKHNVTLREAFISLIAKRPILKIDVHEHPLVPYSQPEICDQCQNCFANLICEHEDCQHIVCIDCHYTNIYNNCGVLLHNTSDYIYGHLSNDDFADLTQYADDYGVSLERAFYEQMRCQECKIDVVPQTFGPGHQFCSARCDAKYELKPMLDHCRCNGGRSDCKWCGGEIYRLNKKIFKKEIGILENEPILATIQSLKDLMVYNLLDDCLVDFVQYAY